MTDLEQPTEPTRSLVTPGTLLTQARERAGMTQEQVAKELHMTLTKVRSIESDEYFRLNTDTFIRGYLRAYANFLKLDSAPIIAAYQQHAASQGLVTERQYPIAKDAPAKKLWTFVIALVLLLAGLWLVSVWFFDNQAERPVVAPSTIMPPVTVPSTTVPTSAPEPAISVAAGSQSPTESQVISDDEKSPLQSDGIDASVSAVAENSTMSDEPEPADEPAAVNSAEKSLDKLELTFVEECWLEVSDAQGDVLATELQRPGSSVSLLGIAPFNVKLGNAPAARVVLNGVDVAINTSPGTKVMTINVGE